MSISSLPRCGFLIPLLLVAACHSDGLGPPLGSCSNLHDAASCSANSACKVGGCPDCDGGLHFSGCYPKDAIVEVACPGIACLPSCDKLTTLADCNANPLCEAAGCPDCNGGKTFAGCYQKGQAPELVCPAVCPDCSQHKDEGSCTTDPSCHSVFADSDACDCIQPGCCMQFTACVNGPAHCTPGNGPLCGVPEPRCEGDFVADYSGSCAVGCVRKSACDDCRVTGCGAGESCQLCWTSYLCMADGNAC